MPTFDLVPHPSSPGSPVRSIKVRAERPAPERITLRYAIDGDLDAIRWPDPAPSRFTHELWRHSCFEAFIAGSGARYRELNLSPSTRYAIYDFDGYRADMRDSDERDIAIEWNHADATLDAAVAMPALAGVAAWRIGLTTIIEDVSSARSFWALRHPMPDQPDFHDERGFVATLAAPRP